MLHNKIIEILQKKNTLSIEKFMQIALYDEQYGYYINRQPFGAEGDFITSAELSQLFGECIGIFIVQLWQLMNRPKKFELIELGAGRGRMMADIIRIIYQQQQCYESCSITIVEISPRLIEEQKSYLKNHIDKISWQKSLKDDVVQKKVAKIFIANEFFDALPSRQYRKYDNDIAERCIRLDENDNIIIANRPFDNRFIDSYVAKKLRNIDVESEIIVEYCPSAVRHLTDICESLNNHGGFALIIDYGYIGADAHGDTLQAVRENRYANLTDNIGLNDLSCHVDFNLLYQIAQKANIKISKIISQNEFLQNIGIELLMQKLIVKATQNEASQIISAKERLIDDSEDSSMGNLFKFMLLRDKNQKDVYPFAK